LSVKLAHRSGEILGKLQRALQLPERPPLLRLALAYGLLTGISNLPHEDSQGPEIPLKVITAGQDVLIDALIADQLGTVVEPTERKRIYKCLVDLGLRVMMEQYEASSDGASEFLVQMAKQGVAS
jgi:hypothetical protein